MLEMSKNRQEQKQRRSEEFRSQTESLLKAQEDAIERKRMRLEEKYSKKQAFTKEEKQKQD